MHLSGVVEEEISWDVPIHSDTEGSGQDRSVMTLWVLESFLGLVSRELV